MRFSLRKSLLVCVVVIASMLINTNTAHARTLLASGSSQTNGGQKITITVEGYKDILYPGGGTPLYKYDVFAYTPGYTDNDYITTEFTISGNIFSSNAHYPLSSRTTGESCTASYSTTVGGFIFISSTTTTYSSVIQQRIKFFFELVERYMEPAVYVSKE